MKELKHSNMIVNPLDYGISMPDGQVLYSRLETGYFGDERLIRYFNYGGVYIDNITTNEMNKIIGE